LKLEFSSQAKTDLALIDQWLLQEASKEVADRVVARLATAALQISKFPYTGQLTRNGNRRLVVEPYLMRYRVEEDRVIILRIRHGAQRRLP
jgi:toxin ParE1/3/4